MVQDPTNFFWHCNETQESGMKEENVMGSNYKTTKKQILIDCIIQLPRTSVLRHFDTVSLKRAEYKGIYAFMHLSAKNMKNADKVIGGT